MKQSGRNQRQRGTNETAVIPHESGKNRCRGWRLVADRSAGKEGRTFVSKRLSKLARAMRAISALRLTQAVGDER